MGFATLEAVRNPKHLHLGFGIVDLMGARALLAALPLLIAGLFGLGLLLLRRLSGAVLVAAFSLTWAVCLGLGQWDDFEPLIAVIAAAYLLTAIWALRKAAQWRSCALTVDQQARGRGVGLEP
jgi:hypothetical protein